MGTYAANSSGSAILERVDDCRDKPDFAGNYLIKSGAVITAAGAAPAPAPASRYAVDFVEIEAKGALAMQPQRVKITRSSPLRLPRRTSHFWQFYLNQLERQFAFRRGAFPLPA
jgi:hypothetical protein